ncbi:uncharacterized protein LOC114190326 isoform X3 [Vigna unguiculata]|uniref:uncharacterized protein LOC114190326 isoform X3 n=1 Tax=Vigna unguiculata TaxID=3917 RepID=UPI001016136E|nr:uncharacterized protein LOC114190326 isoform X3 [Vigna unguiculata]
MEKYFGNAYRGDPGVPHSDPDRFVNIWIGSAVFSVLTYVNPYMWTLSNQFNINNGGGKRLTVLHDSFFSLLPFQSKPDDFDRGRLGFLPGISPQILIMIVE